MSPAQVQEQDLQNQTNTSVFCDSLRSPRAKSPLPWTLIARSAVHCAARLMA